MQNRGKYNPQGPPGPWGAILGNFGRNKKQSKFRLEIPAGRPASQPAKMAALAWLACLLCLALAWSGLGLSCLPCHGLVQQQQQRRRNHRRPPKAAGCCCWTRPRQGRQDRPRPDQAKARHNKQASQKCPKMPKIATSGAPARNAAVPTGRLAKKGPWGL